MMRKLERVRNKVGVDDTVYIPARVVAATKISDTLPVPILIDYYDGRRINRVWVNSRLLRRNTIINLEKCECHENDAPAPVIAGVQQSPPQ